MLLALRGSFAIIPEPARPELAHDAEKWVPVSRLREALGTIRRLA
jgi:hypothetical protein